MPNCINKNHQDFVKLQNETTINPIILSAKISIWQERTGILDRYPTKEEIESKQITFKKEKIINTEYQKNYSLFTKTSDSKSILEEILKNPKSRTIEETAKWLLNNNHLNNVKINLRDNIDKENSGQFSLFRNEIDINKRFPYSEGYFQRVILHELVHSITSLPIKNSLEFLRKDFIKMPNGNFRINENSFIYLKDIDSKTKDYIENLFNIRNQAYNNLIKEYGKIELDEKIRTDPNFYGLTNMSEFIAEIFTNDNFKNQIERYSPTLFKKIIDNIINWLNSIGFNIPLLDKDTNLSRAIQAVIEYTKTRSERDFEAGFQPSLKEDSHNVIFYKKEKISIDLDTKDFLTEKEEIPSLSRIEQQSFIKSIVANSINYFYNPSEKEGLDSVKETIRKKILITLDNGTNEQKSIKEKFKNEFDNLWKRSLNNINRVFGADFKEDAELNESELEKEWEQSLISDISGSESASAGVKWFIMTTPKLDTNNERIINPFTGLIEFIEMKDVFPTMLEKLTKATSANNLVNILKEMVFLNPSYGVMADRLSNNSNLLNMFRSEFTKMRTKSILNTIIEKSDGSMQIKTFDSFNKSRPVQQIKAEWDTIINYNIGEKQEENYYNSFEFNKNWKILDDLKLRILSSDFIKKELSENNILNEDGRRVSNLLFKVSKLIGNNYPILSKEACQNIIKNSRNTSDTIKYFKLFSEISYITKDGKKSDIDAKLLTLADEEEKFRNFDIEVMQTNLHGKPIFPYVLPSMLTKFINKFNTASQSKEIKEELEDEFRKWSEEPARQFDNLFWNRKDENGQIVSEGLVNFKIRSQENSKFKLKIFDSLNYDLLRTLTVAEMEGTKNETTKEGLQYSEMSSGDYAYSQLLYYLGGSSERSKERGKYIYLPIAVPSDSGRTCLLKVPRIPLHTNKSTLPDKKTFDERGFDLTKDKPFVRGDKNKLYVAIYRTVLQEIQRIKQANNLIFNEEELKIGKFVLKDDFNIFNENDSIKQHNEKVLAKIGNFVQYYHYRELKYNSEGKIDLEKTFIKDSRPTGNVFYFTNMVIDNSSKRFKTNKFFEERTKGKSTNFITLSDIEGFTNEGALTSLIENNLSLAEDFIQEFAKQEVNEALKDFRKFEADFTGKTDFIGNGSFEDFITDFTLNEYIHYVNCQTFFTGVTPFYKSINDISKRAKQIIAPGRAPSDLGVREFKAITIADIYLSSNTIDQMSEKIRKTLKKERTFETKQELDKAVEEIISPYRKINIGDAQGYITIKGLKELLIKHGRMNSSLEKVFNNIEKGIEPDIKTIRTLQAIKPFQYNYDYDSSLNITIPSQVKLSYAILLPQFINGTELEDLKNEMEEKNISRAFFESAHKVGGRFIHKIHNEDGTINKNALSLISPQVYKYDSEQIQLEVPTHLEDDTNKLATQIAKLIVANLSDDIKYNVAGKIYNGSELRDHYFGLLVENIKEETNNLIEDLKIEKDENGNYAFKDKQRLKEILEEEIINRGLSENYEDALELNQNGEFSLPLFINNMSKKWESILTSLFSNRIMRQKMPGGSTTLTSTFGLNKIQQSETSIKGIEWIDSKREDHNLRVKTNLKGETVIEVIMGSWSKDFFIGEKRIPLNEIPEELRQMIGYRIPTQAKHHIIVIEVVGFLPEQSKGMIITPDDLIVQMGSDFDIDKLFLMYKSFRRTKNGKFIIPKYNSKEEFETLQIELKELTSELYSATGITNEDETKLADALAASLAVGNVLSTQEALDDLKQEIKNIQEQLKFAGKVNEDGAFIQNMSKRAINNEIIDIYKAILTNPFHQKEIITPADFEDLKEGKKIIERIYNIDDSNTSPVTGSSQRRIRARNITGRALKGIAANYNSFGAISQISKMYLRSDSVFKSKVKISGKEDKYDKIYNIKELIDKYGEENIIQNEDYAIVSFTGLGFNKSRKYYLNIDNKVILENASQGIGAAVDNAKDPIFDALNLTIFTYSVFHSSLLLGQSTQDAIFFYRQPILVELNETVEGNKAIRGDKIYEGKERELVRKIYKNKIFKVYYNNFKDRLDKKIQEFNDTQKNIEKPKIFNSERIMKFLEKNEKATINRELFDFLVEDTKEFIFSTQELYDMLKQDSLDKRDKLEPAKQIKLYINQLYVLNEFNKRKESSEKIDDILKSTKTDSIGAGPEINVSTKLISKINKSDNDEIILIEEVAAVKKIYPKFFGIQEVSKYPPIEEFFENVNRLSKRVLSPLFINESKSFTEFKSYAFRVVGTSQQNQKQLDKFLNYQLYQNFPYFNKDIHFQRVLGINKSPEAFKQNDLNSFKKQSFADKIIIMRGLYSDYIGNHVINLFETPNTYSKNGYKEVNIKKYKDSSLDTIYSEQLSDMYEADDFQKEFVIDLIRYTYFKNSLDFNFESAAKIIPNRVLITLGLGEHLYEIKNLADKGLIFDTNLLETFVKNNSLDTNIVPIVRTKFQRDNKGKVIYSNTKEDQKEDQNKKIPLTINDTPNWTYDSNKGFLSITKKQLANENENTRRAEYISIRKKEGTIIKNSLLKRLDTKSLKGFLEEVQDLKFDTTNDNIVIYYEVNKLGKDGIFEMDHSIFAENNVTNENNNYKSAIISYLGINENKFGLIQPTLKVIEQVKNNCSL